MVEQPVDAEELITKADRENGGYRDVSPTGTEHMTAGHWAYRPALHQHTVQVDPGGCWTLLITGPVIRRWGFWVKGKWKKSNKYFLKHGKHVCD